MAAYDLVTRGTASNVHVMKGGYYEWVQGGRWVAAALALCDPHLARYGTRQDDAVLALVNCRYTCWEPTPNGAYKHKACGMDTPLLLLYLI